MPQSRQPSVSGFAIWVSMGKKGTKGHERARILVGAYSRSVTLNPLQRILQELLNPFGRIRDYSGDDDMSSKITPETTKKPTLKCNFPDCYASFKHKSALTRHRHLHNKTKAFECKDCHKKFKFHTGLQKHKRKVHSNQLPSIFICSYCRRSLCDFTGIRKHLLKVHGLSDEKARLEGRTMLCKTISLKGIHCEFI